MTSDRFDLEQYIIRCWGITDDLRTASSLEEVKTIADYYDILLQRLWDTFEELVHDGQFVQNPSNVTEPVDN